MILKYIIDHKSSFLASLTKNFFSEINFLAMLAGTCEINKVSATFPSTPTNTSFGVAILS